MTIVLLDHLRVGMPEVTSYHGKRHSAHNTKACPCVPKTVEGNARIDPRAGAGVDHPALLMVGLPFLAEHKGTARATGSQLPEEGCAVIGQDDMALLA